ncbi:MAG: S49 family peptidase, partial [Clostridia bacterium]|nr:S49 family peptidase [Clostridia bacterium]
MSSNSSGGFLRGCLIALVVFILVCFIGFIGLFTIAGIIVGAIGETGAAFKTANADYTTEFVSGCEDAADRIAVIDVKGAITSDAESFGGAIANSRQIVKLIRAAKDDAGVKAIIIDLDTPGGEVTASDEIYHELKLCGKPVVAMRNTMAASGGYYVACGANKIVANKFTMTGSIGVIMSSVDVSGLLDWAKVKPEFYTSGKMKTML